MNFTVIISSPTLAQTIAHHQNLLGQRIPVFVAGIEHALQQIVVHEALSRLAGFVLLLSRVDCLLCNTCPKEETRSFVCAFVSVPFLLNKTKTPVSFAFLYASVSFWFLCDFTG